MTDAHTNNAQPEAIAELQSLHRTPGDTARNAKRRVHRQLPAAPRGPHRWPQITPANFSAAWDYELENHITRWILTPVSEAALQWCYYHLPQDLPRYGAHGFVIDRDDIEGIVAAMDRDRLMSPKEYDRAMRENYMLSLQGEGL